MGSSSIAGGISRANSPGTYSYTVKAGMANMPVTFVNWFDAARFTNWLNNGQGVATTVLEAAALTEDGAYTLAGATTGVGFTRNVTATVWIPSEDEWYKAAYYDPNKTAPGVPGYWSYATQSDSISGNTIGVADSANYNDGDFQPTTVRLTNVGAFGLNSQSAYGTNDQNGNAAEFTDGISGTNRILRGGGWGNNATFLINTTRTTAAPTVETSGTGFRVATLIPEPSTALFTILAVGTSLVRRNRRSY
jgi:formylglycine-generating enzyme required for sulfatase activity